MKKESVIGLVIVAVFVGGIGYFFLSSETASVTIPPYVTGEVRDVYEWARTPEGALLLEQLPCYCGCRFEGHLHARHCFWRDDGSFDKHGITCSVCLDIAKKARGMAAEGVGVCDIRYEIDRFYAPNAHLGTPTPLPEGCTAYVLTGDEQAAVRTCANSGQGTCIA